MKASPDIKKYFSSIDEEIRKSYHLAKKARAKGLDPEKDVSIPLAKNMAERVVGLISVVSPQITETKVTERISELEKEYGQLDWRVGFKIAEEVAKEKFYAFKDKQEAMEVGIRVGFAYLTLGIVSAPLEGFIGLKIKKRKDGKEYFALQYAGPIRGAGGTAASTSVILADYVRVKMGYSTYDPEETEINRYTTEVHDYHERVTNLQYHPSDEEIKFMVSHLPVEVDGNPTESFEVSNYKDLPRIETNLIRGGIALVLAEGLCQKAPKLWKRLSKWGQDFDLEWEFLGDFIKLKEKIHAAHSSSNKKEGAKEEKKTVKANNTFIMDLVAGRPILTHPLGVGGFRLRYGRNRTSGFSASALHPATLIVLEKFIAIGTQLKMERPGKAATVTLCDTIEGPIVRLEDGSVLQLKTEEEAKLHNSKVEEIIFLGDILFNYGDFSENGQSLVPAGYCPEWWATEVEKSLSVLFEGDYFLKAAKLLELKEERLRELVESPLFTLPSWNEALNISKKLKVPLHPEYIFYWKLVSGEKILLLSKWLQEGKVKIDEKGIKKIILPYFYNDEIHKNTKKTLDHLGVSHKVINKENIVLERKEATILAFSFDFEDQNGLENVKLNQENVSGKDGLEVINFLSSITIRDKAGTFIGARMGRPEKAKMRQLNGSPQVMFPVGEEGGRMRSFQSALEAGKIRSAFSMFYCENCKKEMIHRSCEECGKDCIQRYNCRFCGDLDKETCRHGSTNSYKILDLNIKYYFEKAKQRINENIVPDLIKGVKGTSNKNHVVEHLAKGILRAKHGIYVNKEGTTRYDCTELPLTHFKPKEIKTSPEKLRSLGYEKDIYGKELHDENQLLELKPQDIILPGYNSLEESAPIVLTKVSKFVDELLVKFYGLEPFYNITKEEDLAGHLVIGLAPHISAGMIGRIIGFSETQGLIAHPMWHAGLRRDCFTSDSRINLYDGKSWKNVQIGEFVEQLNPQKKADNFGTKVKEVVGLKTLGFNPEKNKIELVPIKEFTKHAPSSLLEIETKQGRKIKVTTDHKFLVGKDLEMKRAAHLKVNDNLILPYNYKIPEKDITEINLLEHLQDQEYVCVRGIQEKFKKLIKKLGGPAKVSKKIKISSKLIHNYILRDSIPVSVLKKILTLADLDLLKFTKKAYLGAKRDHIKTPVKISLDKETLELIGFYVAEGFARKKTTGKGLYQVYIAAEKEEIRDFVKDTVKKRWGLVPSEKKTDRVTFSSRIFYDFFTTILQAGSSAYEKRIPPLLLNLPKKKIGHLLRGYYEGDGSVNEKELKVTCDTVSKILIEDLKFIFSRYSIFIKVKEYTKKPGPQVREFYIRKNRDIPEFTITKITISSDFVYKFNEYVGFFSKTKKKKLRMAIKKVSPQGMKVDKDGLFVYDPIISIKEIGKETTYCLNVKYHNVFVNGILTKQCDGDEAAVMMLMDALLNFSRQFLPNSRGSTMDAPLVLTSVINPAEVDDQVHGIDVVWKYPLEFYEASLEMKSPWEVKYGPEQKKIEQLGDRLGTEEQYSNFGFTHHVENFNKGVCCSAYKTLPSMEEKLTGQMEIAKKVRAVDMDDVAKLVIQKHFLKDIKGNLRKFSMQQFRCVSCNTKYRRPPLTNKCSECGGKIIFTITYGSVIKYLIPSLKLAEKYDFSPYLKQTLNIIKSNVDQVFGKEKDKQVGLSSFIN
ncbi:MAG: DNA polymerase II large subunit [Nanoarchaeota archaeon]|nr:DNA polymerase II large subunit [Nanoarchaeota archaeon]MBU1644426.1 DNA polymerase II large subunit [Nanoarchaeota archaeon]MBU1976624.1 DNA polymerase II large subunit [Nanoarchaeota archaeon]